MRAPFWITLAAVVLALTTRPQPVQAERFLFNDLESKVCNSTITDTDVDGSFWDTYVSASEPWIPPAVVKCSITSPKPRNYVEFQVTQRIPSDGIGPEIRLPTNLQIVMGTTYYLAGFFRFQRVGGASIWHDTGPEPYSFDKLFEFRGTGWRWGIGVGWNGWYRTGTAGKFVFDAWYATSVLGDQGPDHIAADQAPYGLSNPLLSSYEEWHGVVLGVKASSDAATGRVQLWVNGTKVIDQAHYTANPGAFVDRLIYSGTVAQNRYDAPPHIRQVDGFMVTDNWQDIVAGGYLGAALPPGPTPTPTPRLPAPMRLRLGP